MTDKEMLEWAAREAGFYVGADGSINDGIETAADFSKKLKRFATLVIAAEREACAKVCEELGVWNETAKYFSAGIRSRRAK
jgi:hypothetical protein